MNFIDQFLQWFFSKLYPNIPLPMPSLDRQPIEATVVAPQAPVVPVVPRFAPMVVKWSKAITHWEGARPDSHNGGNLKYSTLTASWGAKKGHPASDGGFLCQFDSDQQGQDALCNFLTLGCEGQLIIAHPKPCTLEQFTIKYAGNPPLGYKLGIYAMLGVSPQTDIATFLTVV